MKAKPLIVATLTDNEVKTDMLDVVAHADVIELRVDMFDRKELSDIKETFTQAIEIFKKPIIGTIRDRSEGGLFEYKDRSSLYLEISRFCKYIDIELSHGSLIRELKHLIRDSDISFIGSYHNFVNTPDYSELKAILDNGVSLHVDITKIAVTPHTEDDVKRLLRFTDINRDRQIIAISMGDLGRDSRISGGLYGSRMTYGYVVKKTAEGQIYIPELRREIDLLYD
ncbi:MAG: type I 3-dehydroquinate dehydratase [Thermodesulfovibrionales bacterium]